MENYDDNSNNGNGATDKDIVMGDDLDNDGNIDGATDGDGDDNGATDDGSNNNFDGVKGAMLSTMECQSNNQLTVGQEGGDVLVQSRALPSMRAQQGSLIEILRPAALSTFSFPT